MDIETVRILERLARQVPGLRVPTVPRRFLVYEARRQPAGPRLYCWGSQVATRALGCFPDGTHVGRFASAPQLLHVMGYGKELRMVWLDEPEADA